jgi:hypothetical protein
MTDEQSENLSVSEQQLQQTKRVIYKVQTLKRVLLVWPTIAIIAFAVLAIVKLYAK